MKLRRRTAVPAPLPERQPATPIPPHDALQIAIDQAVVHLRNAIEAYAITDNPDTTVGQRLFSGEHLMLTQLVTELVNVHTSLDDLGIYEGQTFAYRKRHLLLGMLTSYFVPELMSEAVFDATMTPGGDALEAMYNDVDLLSEWALLKGTQYARAGEQP